MSRRALLALPVLAIALAGCGGGTEVAPLPQTVEGTVPTQPGAATAGSVKGDPAKGKAVFASAGCSACHTLKAAGSKGTVGPNLDQKKPPLALVLDRVTNGKAPMPAFKGQLTDQQIADVAAYVVKSTSG